MKRTRSTVNPANPPPKIKKSKSQDLKQQNHKQTPETAQEEEELKKKNSSETTDEAIEIEETVPVAEPKGNEAVEGAPAAPGDVVTDTTKPL
jgi:hypothetical protein